MLGAAIALNALSGVFLLFVGSLVTVGALLPFARQSLWAHRTPAQPLAGPTGAILLIRYRRVRAGAGRFT